MNFFKNDKAKIKPEDINDAKLSSANFADIDVQKRAFLNVLGTRIAINNLFSQHIEVSNLYSLYTINAIREKLDIADIYYNDIKIDVRVVFDENKIFIPKSHFKFNIQPDLYYVIKLNNFEKADILGCFLPAIIDKDLQNEKYYFVEKESLIPVNKIKNILKDIKVEQSVKTETLSETEVEKLFIKLLDKHIRDDEFGQLISTAQKSRSLREKFAAFENFEFVSKDVQEKDLMNSDNLLDIIGTQNNYTDADNDETFEEASQEEATKTADEIIEESLEQNNIVSTEQIEVSAENLLAGELSNLQVDIIDKQENETDYETGSIDELDFDLEEPEENTNLDSVDNKLSIEENIDTNEINEPEFSEALPLGNFEDDNNVEEDNNDISDFANNDVLPLNQVDEIKDENEDSSTNSDFNTDTLPLGDFEDDNNIEEDNNDISDFSNNEVLPLNQVDEIKDENEDISTNSDFNTDTLPLSNFEDDNNIEEDNNDISDFANNEVLPLNQVDEIKDENENISTNSDFNTDTLPLGDFEDDNNIEKDNLNNIESVSTLNLETDENFELGNIDDLFNDDDNSIESKENNTNDKLEIKEINDNNIEEAEAEKIEKEEEEENFALPTLKPLSLDEEDSFEEIPVLKQEIKYNYSFEMDSAETEENQTDSEGTPLKEEPEREENEEKEDISITEESDDIADLSELDDFFDDNEDSLENNTQTNTDTEQDNNIINLDDILSEENITEEKDNINNDDNNITALVPQVNLTSNLQNIEKSEDNNVINLDEIIEKTVNQNKKKNLLTSLFKPKKQQTQTEEVIQETTPVQNNNNDDKITIKHIIVMTSSICLLFTSLIALGTFVGIKLSNSIKQPVQPPPTVPTDTIETTVPENNLDNIDSTNLSQPITAKVSDVSWEVPENIAYNDVMREYLQLAGKNIKLTLLNELLLTTEYAYSEKVVVDIQVSKSGDVTSTDVSTSSGSKIIDKIIVSTIKDTLKYLKFPGDEISDPDVNMSLVISF